MVWGLRGEGVKFQGWIGNMDSVRAHSYSSLPPQRGVFPAIHSCCCCCAALVHFRHSSETRNPSPVWVCLFLSVSLSEFGSVTSAEGSSSWEEECAAQSCCGIAQPPHFCAGELLQAAKAGLCNCPFPCVEQELSPMALMFTSWVSQPDPLE